MHAARRGAVALGIALTVTTPLALAAPTTAGAATITATKKPVKKPVKKVTYRWYDLADYLAQSGGLYRASSFELGGETGPSAFYAISGSSVWTVNGACSAIRGYAGQRGDEPSDQGKVQIKADTVRVYDKVFSNNEGEDFAVSIRGARKLTIGVVNINGSEYKGIINTQVYCSKAPGRYDPAS